MVIDFIDRVNVSWVIEHFFRVQQVIRRHVSMY